MKSIRVVAAVLRDADRVLIVRRAPGETGAGFWEFPGGKVEVGETDSEALSREILEELTLVIKVGKFIAEQTYDYPEKRIHLFLYEAAILSGTLQLSEHDAQEWVRPEDLDPEILSFADRSFVSILRGS